MNDNWDYLQNLGTLFSFSDLSVLLPIYKRNKSKANEQKPLDRNIKLINDSLPEHGSR